MTRLALLFLVAFSPAADAGRRSNILSEPPVVSDGLTFDELVYVDVRGAALAMEMVRDDVAALSPEARAEVAESMDFLVRNCPFTRASVQIPRALHQVFDGTPLGEVDGGFAQSDWATFRRGLAAHVATLDGMGATLTLPQSGDHLFRVDSPPWLVDQDRLVGPDGDALAATEVLVAEVDNLVDELSDKTREQIRFHTARVDRHLGHSWNLGNHLRSWHDGLLRLEPFVDEPGPKKSVERMKALLEESGTQGC